LPRTRTPATSKPARKPPAASTDAFTKTAEADAEIEAVFDALAHWQRRQILMVLNFHDGPMSAGVIAQRFACAWPTTTRHLRLLEEAGLVHVEVRGRERMYDVERDKLRRVLNDWSKWFAKRAR
jgi:DNA-binding transcriptional ArsR family regulator